MFSYVGGDHEAAEVLYVKLSQLIRINPSDRKVKWMITAHTARWEDTALAPAPGAPCLLAVVTWAAGDQVPLRLWPSSILNPPDTLHPLDSRLVTLSSRSEQIFTDL